MASNSSSKFMLWLQTIISVIVISWLSYDFFHTVFSGVTYKLRLNDTLYFNQHPFVFVITVGIKLAVYTFFVWLFRDCVRQLRN